MDDLSLSQWDNEVVIGKGGSSTVYRARLKLNGRFVAVKQVETDGMTRDQVSGIKGEIETSRGLSHANIISYLGAIQKQNNIFILLEYADRGSLRQFYQKHGKLTEAHTVYCLRQILDGLSYLHSNGYTHRDVKCANCLLCSDGSVKLADFGASKKFDSHSIVSGLKGTPQWMSPEVSSTDTALRPEACGASNYNGSIGTGDQRDTADNGLDAGGRVEFGLHCRRNGDRARAIC